MSEFLAAEHVLQHVAVSLVAIGAAAVVLRKVLGVFETRPAAAGRPPANGQAAGPACSHCAAGHAAQAKPR